MSRPSTSDNSSAVGLFPFLAVLLCTMGALLVLLVVLAQRIGSDPIAVAESVEDSSATSIASTADPNEAEQLSSELALIGSYQEQLDKLKQQGQQQLAQDKARLSHSEEHIRRLEHELAQLSLSADQLKATEDEQMVDEQQAEKELARLEQLIEDTEADLEKLRESTGKERSYALVPFKGKNGTYARPIYIICDEHGITLEPEGLRFTETDFIDPTWPGNPLAAALRASREYLIRSARAAGEPDPLDPYPLIVVRPKGVKSYQLARTAIKSWDASYGYEFIDVDMKLTFPDLPDPQLARTQQHAVMVARERLSMLAQAAPSKFRGTGSLGGSRRGSGRGSVSMGPYDAGFASASGDGDRRGESLGANGAGNRGDGAGDELDFNGNGSGSRSNSSNSGGGGDSWVGSSDQPGGSTSSDAAWDVAGGASGGVAGEGALAGGPAGSGELGRSGSNQASGGSAAGGSQSQSGSSSGISSGAAPNMASTDPSSQAGGLMGNDNVQGAAPSLSFTTNESIADARGSDWAVRQATRNAVPIQRPIQVVVRENQVALLPSRHSQRGAGATGTVISLDQPLDKISDQLATALKSRIDDWGLAGNGLYWRPVLELRVGPEAGAGGTADRLVGLLRNSGVDIRLPQTAKSKTTSPQSSTIQRGEGGHGF